MEIILNSPSNPVFFTLMGYPVRYYGIILSLAILIGILFSEYIIKLKYCKKTLEIFQDSVFPVTVCAIFGARIFYVLGSIRYFLDNPKEIIMINHGGISIWGAVLFGICAIFVFSKIKRVSFLKYIDFYAVTIPLCQAVGRFGNYFNQEAYGKPTQGIIKLFIDKSHRYDEYLNIDFYHPTFLYESILDLVIFLILFNIYKNKKQKSGVLFALYLIFYSIARLIVESFRIDSILNISNIPIASLISILSALAGIFVLIYIHHKEKSNKIN